MLLEGGILKSIQSLVVPAVVLAFAQTVQADLIQDRGFELGKLTKWQQSGNTISDTVTPPNNIVAAPHSGNYQMWMGAPSGTSSISQTVKTSSLYKYNVSFWLADDVTGPASYNITWGGTSYLANSGPIVNSFGYTKFSFTAPYLGTPTTELKFTFYNLMDWFRLDDVSVLTSRIPVHSTRGSVNTTSVPDQGVGIVFLGVTFGGLFALAHFTGVRRKTA